MSARNGERARFHRNRRRRIVQRMRLRAVLIKLKEQKAAAEGDSGASAHSKRGGPALAAS